jgi:hypothetical protein
VETDENAQPMEVEIYDTSLIGDQELCSGFLQATALGTP